MVVAIQYIAYTSRSIASGPKYLTGARHFLRDIYPDFDKNRASAFVQTTIRASVKLRADLVRRKNPLRIHPLILFHNLASESKSYDDMIYATTVSYLWYSSRVIVLANLLSQMTSPFSTGGKSSNIPVSSILIVTFNTPYPTTKVIDSTTEHSSCICAIPRLTPYLCSPPTSWCGIVCTKEDLPYSSNKMVLYLHALVG